MLRVRGICRTELAHLAWPYHELPFFDEDHHRVISQLVEWCSTHGELDVVEEADPNAATKRVVRQLGQAGLLRLVVADGPGHDGSVPAARLDSRSIALAREILAHRSVLADCAFAIQGIGSGPISSFGSAELQAKYLPGLRTGITLPGLALSEPQGASDVARILTSATADGACFVINGEKTWISNGGVADLYVVVARTGEAPGARGLSAFVVEAGTPGLDVTQFAVINDHPIATLQFSDCRVPASNLIGTRGQGFQVAMANLDIFRPTVGASALGMARRAFDETLAHTRERRAFDKPLSEIETVQARLADMSVELELATLVVYRAAWAADRLPGRQTRLAATAKLAATEAAQRVIDTAVQLHGGYGVKRGHVIERLYRDIRPLRIGEGASDIQRMIIGRAILQGTF